MTAARVGIIIPAYNRGYVIKRAIEGVLQQTFGSYELIVVDDGSVDNTKEVVASIKDERLRYIRNPINMGCGAARERGIEESQAEFIALLDSDDYWYKEKLKREMDIFQRYDEADFIFTNGYYKKEGQALFRTQRPSGFIPQRRDHFPLRDILPLPSGWVFKREVFYGTGPFDRDLFPWEDGDFFVRAARRYRVYFLNEPLVFWYSPQENFSQEKELKVRELFLKKHKDQMSLDRGYYYRFLITLGKDYLRVGNRDKARESFCSAVKVKPLALNGWRKLSKALF